MKISSVVDYQDELDEIHSLIAEGPIEPLSDAEYAQITNALVSDILELRREENGRTEAVPRVREPIFNYAFAAAAAFIIVVSGCAAWSFCNNLLPVTLAKNTGRWNAEIPETAGGEDDNPRNAQSNEVIKPLVQKLQLKRNLRDDSEDDSYSKVVTPALDTPARKIIVVLAGDNLSKIASRELGSPNRWQAIWNANRDVLGDPNFIKPGQKLEIAVAGNPNRDFAHP